MIVTNSLSGGGAERSMNLLANELTSRGWAISLVPINSGLPDLVNPTCEVFALERNFHGSFKETLVAFKRFNKVVWKWKPDILILNCDLPELFGSAVFSRCTKIAVEHSTFPWIQRMPLGRLVRTLLSRRSVQWIYVSAHVTNWKINEKRRTIIQNPMTPNSLVAIENHPQSVILRLLFVGRLSKEKRPDTALYIASKTQLPLEIYGDGLLLSNLTEKVLQEGISVNFNGYVPAPWQHSKEGDLLIVPSDTEGDGLVVLEGLQAGIPMLLADIPDLRRFGFPDVNYCKEGIDYVERIKEYSNNLKELVIPKQIANSLLSERSITLICDEWEELLLQKNR